MKVPEEPVQRDRTKKSVALSIGGKLKIPIGPGWMSEVQDWYVEQHMMEETVGGAMMLEVDYVGVLKNGQEPAREIRVMQTFELEPDGSVGRMVQNSMEQSMMEAMGPNGGIYYESNPGW